MRLFGMSIAVLLKNAAVLWAVLRILTTRL
jgi:hypothetical protein